MGAEAGTAATLAALGSELARRVIQLETRVAGLEAARPRIVAVGGTAADVQDHRG